MYKEMSDVCGGLQRKTKSHSVVVCRALKLYSDLNLDRRNCLHVGWLVGLKHCNPDQAVTKDEFACHIFISAICLFSKLSKK